MIIMVIMVMKPFHQNVYLLRGNFIGGRSHVNLFKYVDAWDYEEDLIGETVIILCSIVMQHMVILVVIM